MSRRIARGAVGVLSVVLQSCLGCQGNVGRPHAHRLIALVGAAVRVVRCPAGLVLKEANRADIAVGAEIEPVVRAAGNAQQITCFDLNRDDGSLTRVNMKQAAAANDETYLVFVMPVLGVE